MLIERALSHLRSDPALATKLRDTPPESILADILFHSVPAAAGAACAVVSLSSPAHLAANARMAGTDSTPPPRVCDMKWKCRQLGGQAGSRLGACAAVGYRRFLLQAAQLAD